MQSNTATEMQPVAAPPEAVLTEIAFGAMMTQALYVAAKLGIADLLKDAPRSAAELARATDTHERSLYRVLRSLAGAGIFRETESKVFANTPLSDAIRSDTPNSMRNGAIFMGEAWHYNVWGNMMHSVRTGETAWKKTHGGAEVFDYFNDFPEHGEIFNRAMTDMSVATAPAVVEAYDFSGIEIIADIAGGHGYLLAQILKANPNLKGVLFDVPSVIQGADGLLKREGVNERVEPISGDFFAEVPAADAYIMKHIIHDWDDERSIKILKSIYAAMKTNGKVLIVEAVLPEGNEPHYGKLLDLEMLTSPGGAERTAEEYRALLAQAGFKLTRIVATKSPFSIVEAVKA
jgi:DNA-binding Lrp family transcriptional regulator